MRLIAVLGYSDRRTTALHPVCAARLAHAESIVQPDDTVLLSGWARRQSGSTEAELMAAAWTADARRVVLDRDARSTVGNALGIARVVRRTGARDVVLVTSGWHGTRASVLVRAALTGSPVAVALATTDERGPRRARLRELGCWLAVPLLAIVAARAR
jgi:uncharacterized SAM-binding protein YcdF (DUF218 family)